MLIKDIPKSQAIKLQDAIKELRPAMQVSVVAEDTALYQLGLVTEVPVTIEIIAAEAEVDELVDEVDQMEVDAFNYTDEMKPSNRDALKRYERYAIIEAYLSGRE